MEKVNENGNFGVTTQLRILPKGTQQSSNQHKQHKNLPFPRKNHRTSRSHRRYVRA
ncbi:MAG: hypothetical protein ACOYOT_08140 [Bacteroidales bacterium]